MAEIIVVSQGDNLFVHKNKDKSLAIFDTYFHAYKFKVSQLHKLSTNFPELYRTTELHILTLERIGLNRYSLPRHIVTAAIAAVRSRP